jgi:hypothetical protein
VSAACGDGANTLSPLTKNADICYSDQLEWTNRLNSVGASPSSFSVIQASGVLFRDVIDPNALTWWQKNAFGTKIGWERDNIIFDVIYGNE